jgi:tRNA/tmRNA/rRNA uracil-C5-methylase (TrmA/RlmC/RlmD family)
VKRPSRPAGATKGASVIGAELELDVGPVAHGGHCVARHEGRAVFVRHALPGERVRAVVTEGRERDRFWRADAVRILTPSPERVPAPCPWAGPGRCGGCDWQHAAVPAQRVLKAAVVREQLRRLAGLDLPVQVEAVAMPDSRREDDAPGRDDGLAWRTRVRLHVRPDGRAGLLAHRSHAVVPIEDCLIAHRDLDVPEVLARDWSGHTSIEVLATSASGRVVWPGPPDTEAPMILERAAGRAWRLSARSFWQVHPGGPEVLVGAVLAGLGPHPGERALDLYAGVGLFAGALAEAVGGQGAVAAIEGDAAAVGAAAANLADLPWVSVVHGEVAAVLAGSEALPVDLVVLDPPRVGAGRDVVHAIADRAPRAVAYVACDPAALGRDVATFAAQGYALTSLRAFDLFPHTHHVECVAILTPVAG